MYDMTEQELKDRCGSSSSSSQGSTNSPNPDGVYFEFTLCCYGCAHHSSDGNS